MEKETIVYSVEDEDEEEQKAIYQTFTIQVRERESLPEYAYCYAIARGANNLFNTCVFLQRQVFFATKKDPAKWSENERNVMEGIEQALPLMGPDFEMPTQKKWKLSYKFLEAYLRATNNENFFNEVLSKQSAQHVVKEVARVFKAYVKALAKYRKNPEKYTGEPGIPHYRKSGDCHTVYLTNQDAKLEVREDGSAWLTLPKVSQALEYAEQLRLNDEERARRKTEAENNGQSVSGKEFREPPVPVTRFEGEMPKTQKLPIKVGDIVKGRNDLRLKQVTVKPYQGTFRIQLNFESSDTPPQIADNPVRACCIDLGVDNLAAITNNAGLPCLIFKGGCVKSVNQRYNKRMAEIVSAQTKGTTTKFKPTAESRQLCVWRKNHIDDFMHKVAKHIVNWCVTNRIELIIIGQNKGWKQEVNMGPENNQKFVTIPFDQLKKTIKYLSFRHGIQVVFQEESYTSQASYPDRDFIPTYGQTKGKPKFSGQRGPAEYNGHRKRQKTDPKTKKPKTTNPGFRGLYKPKNPRCGEVINSDLNGSANIGRKYRADLFDIGMEPNFQNVIIIRHPDDIHRTVQENRKKQLKEREGQPPSKSKLHRRNIRFQQHLAKERKM